jgi:hypothetical protein
MKSLFTQKDLSLTLTLSNISFLPRTLGLILLVSCLLFVSPLLSYSLGKEPQFIKGTFAAILTNIHTIPSVIHVNDSFSMGATLVNNSTVPLKIWNDGCKGPLSTSFDKHVVVNEGTEVCNLFISPSFRMQPGTSRSSIAGSTDNKFSEHYKAISAGTTTSTIKLEFQVTSGSQDMGFNNTKQDTMFASCIYLKNSFSPCIVKFTILGG